MAELTEIEATYRVVTPLFCGGADQRQAELRLPSFKGVLRFWWRALAWSRHGGNLEKIKEEEDTLFGSASEGQSRVFMRLIPDGAPLADEAGNVLKVGNNVVGDGTRYLGYGVMEAFNGRITKAGRLTRACLIAPFDFTVQICLCNRRLNEIQLRTLQDALIASGTLGGMGAKSRKGYGSLAIRSLRVNGEPRCSPQSINDLYDVIKAFGNKDNTGVLPEFTALSAAVRHILLSSDKRAPLELLDLIGRELMRYRSWGRHGMVLGQPSERNFRDDHDLMKSSRPNAHPQRIAFGLPHNYGKKQVVPNNKNFNRRASPLFIHIHECGGSPVAILSFLPARFLPEGKSDISVDGHRVHQTSEDKLYQPIHDFLDRLLDSRQRKEPFTEVREVKP